MCMKPLILHSSLILLENYSAIESSFLFGDLVHFIKVALRQMFIYCCLPSVLSKYLSAQSSVRLLRRKQQFMSCPEGGVTRWFISKPSNAHPVEQDDILGEKVLSTSYFFYSTQIDSSVEWKVKRITSNSEVAAIWQAFLGGETSDVVGLSPSPRKR